MCGVQECELYVFLFFILFVLEVTSEGFGLIDSSGQNAQLTVAHPSL